MDNCDYKAHLAALLAQVTQQIAAGQPLSIDQVVEGLIPDHPDNIGLRDLLARTAKIAPREFDKAMDRKATKDALGIIPKTAAEFVTAVAKQENIGCRYDGTLFRTGPRHVKLSNGEAIALTSEHLQDEHMRTFAHLLGGGALRFSEFQRHIRMRRDELKLSFLDSQIADATEEWYVVARRERLFEIYSDVGGSLNNVEERERTETQLLDLAKNCFDTADTSPEFITAMLKKFIWQVKRKVLGIDVTDHLMIVLLGAQGSGKSTFVRGLISPLSEITAMVDFKMIADDRNIDMWSNFIMFIDEMGYATMTDVDVIKNIISAPTLTRRPMRSNAFDIVKQNGTFIGCSNKKLNQLVRDPTGARRFAGLHFRRDADWNLINSMCWANLWRLVDAKAEDPTIPFKAELKAQQEQGRYRNSVETWLVQFDPMEVSSIDWDDSTVRAKVLYSAFRKYEDEFHPGSRTSITEWGTEMTRLAENHSSAPIFEKFRKSDGNWYRYLPSSASKKVVLLGGPGAAAA
jgi:energy-coupling factor transporter ATP-binding protein EcfA2